MSTLYHITYLFLRVLAYWRFLYSRFLSSSSFPLHQQTNQHSQLKHLSHFLLCHGDWRDNKGNKGKEKDKKEFKMTLQGWTNMTPSTIFFVGHYLKGLSGCWAILKRKSVTFASYCQSSTILGSQHQLFARPRRVTDSRSTFNTLWLTQSGMYCITMTVVGLCVPPISLVHAMKVMGINRKRRHHRLVCLIDDIFI